MHFFFPKDYAHAVADSITDFANRTSLRRYFYSQGGKNYMLVGVPLTWITSAPAGDLIIDPTTTVTGNDDVYLQDATQYGSNSSLVIGKSTGTYKKRTIIKFNVSGVLSGATVINAQMKLRYYGTTGSTWIDRSVQAHQLLRHWREMEADSLKRRTGSNWLLPRGKIGPGSDSTLVDANGFYESTVLFKNNEFPVWKNWDLTTLTQKWINGTATNYGIILWATNEDNSGMNLWFRSSDYTTDPTMQPKLEIIWSQTLQAVYFLKDHLGSIRATVYDSAAAVLGYDDYDPWGYPLAQRTKAIPTPYLQGGSKIKFTGKEYDDEFGLNLVYFGARYYDWLRGQWVSVEPLAEKYPSLGPYVYVANNPVNAIDKDGKDIINNSSRPVAIIGDDEVGYNKTVLRYKVLGPNQNSRFIYDAEGNWTGGWDFTDYDFFNYEGVWYKAPNKRPDFRPWTWVPPLNYWITDKWGANHPFNFLVRKATLEELRAIKDWLILAGAPPEVIKEMDPIIERAEREQQKNENQGKSKKSKSEEEKQKQKKKDRNKDDDENNSHAGWGAENQGPPPIR